MQRVNSLAGSDFVEALAAKMVASRAHMHQEAAAAPIAQEASDDDDESNEEVYVLSAAECESVTTSTGLGQLATPKLPGNTHIVSDETLANGVQVITFAAGSAQSSSSQGPGLAARSSPARAAPLSSPTVLRNLQQQTPDSPSTVDTDSMYTGSPGSTYTGRILASSVKSIRSVSTTASHGQKRRNYTFRELLKTFPPCRSDLYNCF
jgi:hypothetical protein